MLKFVRSFSFALKGILHAFKTQQNLRIQCLAGMLALVLCGVFEVRKWEWLAVVLSISGVLTAECLNTAIEELTDLTSPQFHPKAGHAKDLAAGAVLLMAVGACVTGLIIFLPRFQLLFW